MNSEQPSPRPSPALREREEPGEAGRVRAGSSADPVNIGLIGKGARRTLSGHAPGRVIAVFKRSLYVETPGGLACLGAASLGAGPLNALSDRADGLDEPLAGLSVGAPVRIDGLRIDIDGRLSFSLDRATDWRPARGPWSVDRLGPGVAALLDLALGRAPADGLAPVTFRGEGPPQMIAATAAFRDWLDDLATAGPVADPPFDAEGLIGLGPGLTPAGDDYLGGALVALRAFGRADIADPLGTWVLAAARHRTTTISRAHLALAAAGEGAEALHVILEALAGGRIDRLAAGLDRIDSIGHTSGWDALAGAVAACAALDVFGRTSNAG